MLRNYLPLLPLSPQHLRPTPGLTTPPLMFILLEMITRAASATSHPHVTLTTLHMLTSLTHPTRLNPISATSSLAAALPLMGGLVSISKAVGAVNWGLQPQVLGYQLQLLLAKQVLQLVTDAATAASAPGNTRKGAVGKADAAGREGRRGKSGGGVENENQGQEQQEEQQQEQQLSALLWCAMKLAAGACEPLMDLWTDREDPVGVGGAGMERGTGTEGLAGAGGGLELDGGAKGAGTTRANRDADAIGIGRCSLLEVITGRGAAGGMIKGVAGGENMGQYICGLAEAVQQACTALQQLIFQVGGQQQRRWLQPCEISTYGIAEARAAAKQKEEEDEEERDVSIVSPMYALRLCLLDGHIEFAGLRWEGEHSGDDVAVLKVLQRLAGISRKFMSRLGAAFCCSNAACECFCGCSELAGLVGEKGGGGGGLCPKCKRVWYCSRGCQVKDWAVHCVSCRGR